MLFFNTLVISVVLFCNMCAADVFALFDLHHAQGSYSAPSPVLTVAGPNLWVLLKDATVTEPYSIQDDHVVFGESSPSQSVLMDADPATFVVPSYWSNVWGKDATHVYFSSFEIPSADASTFSPVFDMSGKPSPRYLKDKNHVYTTYPYDSPEAHSIPGADVTTFVAVEPPESCGTDCQFDAQDIHHKYYRGFIVQQP